MIVAVAAVSGYLWWNSTVNGSRKGVTVDKVALDIETSGADGVLFRLGDHRGEVVIVEFMTTRCPFCILQFEEFKSLHGKPGVFLASIVLDQNLDPQSMESLAEDKGVEWFMGHSLKAGLDYKVTAVPTVIVVDPEGVIRYRGHYTSFNMLEEIINQIT